MLVFLSFISTKCTISITPKEWIKEVTSEGLCPNLVITAIKINRLLQTERVNPFKAFALILYLLGVRKVAQRHSTVVQGLTTLLLFAAECVEIRHCVGLRDLVLRQLIKIGLN